MRRRWACIILLVFSVFILAGCSDEKPHINPDDQGNPSAVAGTENLTDDQENSSDSTDVTDPGSSAVNSTTVGAFTPVRINYYTVDAKTDQLRMAAAMLNADEKLTPSLVLSYIVDSLEDSSVILGIDSVNTDGDLCVISFDSSIKDISVSDPDLEEVILDACAQSIIDNFDDINRICMRILGEAYITEGHTFAFDYIYMDE